MCVPPPVVSRTCRVFLSSACSKVDLMWKGVKERGFGGVPHVLKLLPDKISSSRLQPEVAM